MIGNPVAHSRSPQLHNAAMAAAGLDSVYLPLLVDDLRSFLETFSDSAYGGFSVTIPHKVGCLDATLRQSVQPFVSPGLYNWSC